MTLYLSASKPLKIVNARRSNRKVAKERGQSPSETQFSVVKKRTPKKTPKFGSALRVRDLEGQLPKLGLEVLFAMTHTIRKHLFWAIGDPTEAKIREIHQDCNALGQVIDFDLVVQRLKLLCLFDRSSFGVRLSNFFPELNSVYGVAVKLILESPRSVKKTELWLEPIAREAGAGADIEALVYFASRGRNDLVEPSALRDLWLRSICLKIRGGGLIGKPPKDVLARASNFTISLCEAADVLQFNGNVPRFFSFRDEEEDFIDASFFRAVEWLNVTGFDRWLKSLIVELSTGPQYAIDHGLAGWALFNWSRSSLALRMADRNGLEAWLWAVINGPIERDKPWLTVSAVSGSQPRCRNYVPLAGIIPFVWHRINPTNMKEDVVVAASKLLLECQTRAGGWPTYSDEAEPCLLATCTAIHGLALSKPKGWQQATAKAAEWLLRQQDSGGHWDIKGGPTVMLSVLALDSINLGNGSDRTTFDAGPPPNLTSRDGQGAELNYSNEKWFRARLPKTNSVALKKAQKRFRPALCIVVATETELRATLKRLRPGRGLTGVWQVPHGSDTFYLGRFGAFEAALTLCSAGTIGATGSTLASDSIIRIWRPKAILMPGIAFGVDRTRHGPGDILIAQQIIPYEAQRQGDNTQFRNPIPPASDALLNRFRNAVNWEFFRPDGSKCRAHFGPMLSGEKLIDSNSFKQSLLNIYPTAIGGEMEGAGLWAGATRNKTEWLLVKGVCDWADGHKNDDFQQLAAAASISLCEHVFQNPQALAGI